MAEVAAESCFGAAGDPSSTFSARAALRPLLPRCTFWTIVAAVDFFS